MAADTFLDRLIERVDRLDPTSVQGYILKLVREKGFLETIFQTIREGVVIIDRDLEIHFVNNAAMTLLGLPTDCDGQKINRFLRELDWQRLMAQDPHEWERACRQEIEVFYPAHRYLQFYLLPYKNSFDDDQALGMATIILHDVTELRESAESDIESEKLSAITMLAAGVAHEIGNPLNSLDIHLQLLERRFRQSDGGQDDALELLAIARQEVSRLDAIITQFLQAIRPAQVELRPTSLKKLISETIAFMKQEIENRGVNVEVTIAEHIPTIAGDEDQLKQALYNVVQNAIQAMPDGGCLGIDLSVNRDFVELSFRDTGVGIEANDLGDVFNPYYTQRDDGTGLGLMIVERIIREHGGELGIESEVGQGTVITFKFPLESRRRRLLSAPSTAEPPTTVVSEPPLEATTVNDDDPKTTNLDR